MGADSMRLLAFAVVATFTLASASAFACPMQTVSKSGNQTVASNNGNPSTPIPKRQSGSNV
jgi:hypothetical protein